MQTATEQDKQLALETLERLRDTIETPGALLIISQELGKGETDYYRVAVPGIDHWSGLGTLSNLTWHFGKMFGYTVKERRGYWFLAIRGGNFSKPDEIARTLADFYGVERIRYEVL
jgi:hypothetical protein